MRTLDHIAHFLKWLLRALMLPSTRPTSDQHETSSEPSCAPAIFLPLPGLTAYYATRATNRPASLLSRRELRELEPEDPEMRQLRLVAAGYARCATAQRDARGRFIKNTAR